MKLLSFNVLPEEFVVDHKPEPVHFERGEGEQDLMSVISQMMVENERLQDLNHELKQVGSQPVEVEKLIRSLLPTLDSFDRTLAMARSSPPGEEVDNWLKTVESIYYRLLNMLESYGVYQLKAIGKKVDLNLHEVVEVRQSADHPHDVVIGERQKGYVFRGKLLRDAKVVVASNERR